MISANTEAHPRRSLTFAIALLLALPLSLAACNREASDGNSDESTPSAFDLRDVVEHYEAIRHKLLEDQTDGIKKEADTIAALSIENANPTSEGIGRAAKQLSSKANDLEAARLAFGKLSQQLVAALATDAQLKRELRLFSCPMAKGYGKWIQSDADLGNPYMGQQMPSCGSHAEW